MKEEHNREILYDILIFLRSITNCALQIVIEISIRELQQDTAARSMKTILKSVTGEKIQ